MTGAPAGALLRGPHSFLCFKGGPVALDENRMGNQYCNEDGDGVFAVTFKIPLWGSWWSWYMKSWSSLFLGSSSTTILNLLCFYEKVHFFVVFTCCLFFFCLLGYAARTKFRIVYGYVCWFLEYDVFSLHPCSLYQQLSIFSLAVTNSSPYLLFF